MGLGVLSLLCRPRYLLFSGWIPTAARIERPLALLPQSSRKVGLSYGSLRSNIRSPLPVLMFCAAFCDRDLRRSGRRHPVRSALWVYGGRLAADLAPVIRRRPVLVPCSWGISFGSPTDGDALRSAPTARPNRPSIPKARQIQSSPRGMMAAWRAIGEEPTRTVRCTMTLAWSFDWVGWRRVQVQCESTIEA